MAEGADAQGGEAMKFQLNIEVDEKQAGLSQKTIIDFTLEALADTYGNMDTYYDVGVNTESIVSGLTS